MKKSCGYKIVYIKYVLPTSNFLIWFDKGKQNCFEGWRFFSKKAYEIFSVALLMSIEGLGGL